MNVLCPEEIWYGVTVNVICPEGIGYGVTVCFVLREYGME